MSSATAALHDIYRPGRGCKKTLTRGKWIRWSLIVLKSPQGISDMTHIPFSYAHHVQAVKESYFESMNCKTMQFENSSKTAIGPMAAMWVGEWIATFFWGGKPAELRTGSSGSSGSNLSTQNDRPQVPLFWLQISWFSCIARIACIAVILSYFISKIAIWGGFIMTKGLGPSMAALPSKVLGCSCKSVPWCTRQEMDGSNVPRKLVS